MELLIGAGSNKTKKLWLKDGPAEWSKLVTLDFNPDHGPDVVHDLMNLPLPFPDNSFSEIHAYEVLEHTGQQGDFRFFLAQWADFWRLLKPGGLFFGTSPAPGSPWVWGDPGHTRAMCKESFVFLVQPEYRKQVGITPMSDYRFVYQADFDPIILQYDQGTFTYILKAVKPARI